MLLWTVATRQSGVSQEMFLTIAGWLAWQETFTALTPTADDLNLGVEAVHSPMDTAWGPDPSRYYDNFSLCTERETNAARCFWPNRLAQGFITGIHKQFFSNCTSEKVHWEDPPDEILITLILIPVLLMVAMISLVVWCSKRSDILVVWHEEREGVKCIML
ncbi:putative G-protein coupled receptor 139 [Platysternon megacephalum]|uniref:Receptor activity-modifying protein 3 n=1 Tax=Platysternon megacephalum TaxID=55544 RepID=A0A4D9DLS7_9SAUR|nr:putative G-protein coupled receptor 139 [Platysternon megacephalum]